MAAVFFISFLIVTVLSIWFIKWLNVYVVKVRNQNKTVQLYVCKRCHERSTYNRYSIVEPKATEPFERTLKMQLILAQKRADLLNNPKKVMKRKEE